MSDVVNPMPGMSVSIRVEGSGLPGGGTTGDVLTKTESGAEWKTSKQDIPTTVPQVQYAQVGQTVVVKAVDENGKPTEWEAKDVSGGSDDIFIVHVEVVIDAENGTVMIATDKTFEETWEVVNRAFEAQEAPTGTPKLIFMHFMDTWAECSGYMISRGVKVVKFAGPFSLQGAEDGGYKSMATHVAWREDGTINSYTVEIPAEYCKFDSAVPVNAPMEM